jgi:Stress responsive A/B Barrel Domain
VPVNKLLACGLALTLVVAGFLALSHHAETLAADDKGAMISHNVYFALKDDSADARKKLVADCKKYLSDHPGTLFFAAGARVEELDRPVNDKDWDVGLHIVFKTKADHDKYQDAAKHKTFIAENEANWKKVRVFDTKVEAQ